MTLCPNPRTACVILFFTVISSLHKTRDLPFLIYKSKRQAMRIVMSLALASIAVFGDLSVLALMGSVTAIVFFLVVFGQIGACTGSEEVNEAGKKYVGGNKDGLVTIGACEYENGED
jgi:hypothetical protein